MNDKLLLVCLLLILLILLPGINQQVAAELKEFNTEYIGELQGLPFKVQVQRSLRKLEKGTYQLASSARGMLITVSEVSEFTMADGRVVPMHYLYQRKGIGKNKHESAYFNWSDLTVESKGSLLDIQPGTLDKLLYQYQLREDVRLFMSQQEALIGSPNPPSLVYQILDAGRLKEYRFRVTGQEQLDTPLGDTTTVRVERVRADDKRQTSLWLATEHDYLLVRLRHVGKDKKWFEINLSALGEGSSVED